MMKDKGESTQYRVQGCTYSNRRRRLPLKSCVARLRAFYRDFDMSGNYKHPERSVGVGGKQSGGQQRIKDENGVALRNKIEVLKG